MKPITHAHRELMLEYFEVLENQLRRALGDGNAEYANDAAFVDGVAARVHERMAGIAARLPDADVPSLQQIRKNLEAVLDPAFFGGSAGDPLKAVEVLRRQLGHQKVYTPPEGGKWTPRGRPRRAKR